MDPNSVISTCSQYYKKIKIFRIIFQVLTKLEVLLFSHLCLHNQFHFQHTFLFLPAREYETAIISFLHWWPWSPSHHLVTRNRGKRASNKFNGNWVFLEERNQEWINKYFLKECFEGLEKSNRAKRRKHAT